MKKEKNSQARRSAREGTNEEMTLYIRDHKGRFLETDHHFPLSLWRSAERIAKARGVPVEKLITEQLLKMFVNKHNPGKAVAA